MRFLKIASKINTALDIKRELGLKRFIEKIPPWIFHRSFYFFSQSLLEKFTVQSFHLPFRLEIAAEKDLPYLLEVRPLFYHLADLQERLKEGHFCFLGWVDARPVHIRWVFQRSVHLPYLRKTVLLSPEEVFCDEVYTKPEYRRQGFYSYSGYLMRLVLQDMGYHRFLCAFASWNEISQNASKKLGMKKIGGGGYWNILGIRNYDWEGSVQDRSDGKISIR